MVSNKKLNKKQKKDNKKIKVEIINKPVINDDIRDEMSRRLEALQIIYQLKQNELSSKYSAIKELLQKLNTYVIEGKKQEFKIPFPEKNKIIKGYLPIYKDEKCVVVLKHID
jgi:hypothetical protein